MLKTLDQIYTISPHRALQRFKPYMAANSAIFKKFGGRWLVRGGKFDVAEGNAAYATQSI
jgi:uncharacterized protein (DUF1330 family)